MPREGRIRLLLILMTKLTTVVGLLPMELATLSVVFEERFPRQFTTDSSEAA